MDLLQDVRYGLRLLRRSPIFTVVAIGSLAIGLGGAVALFTGMNAVLFRPLPGQGTSDLYAIYTSDRDGGNRFGGTSYADFQSFVGGAPELFAGACAATDVRANLVLEGVPAGEPGAIVSEGCFDLLKLKPHAGRFDMNAGGPSIVISHLLWTRRLGGDANAVGRTVLVNGVSATVAGVAPPGFAGVSFDSGAMFWAQPAFADALIEPGVLTNRQQRRFHVFARLGDGVDRPRAEARLAVVAAGLRAEYPRAWTTAKDTTRTVTVMRESDARFAGNPGAAGAIAASAFGAIAVVVGLACVNLATMVMARGASRTRELNVRLALGASRGRILRQLATESLLLAAGGVAIAVALVAAGLRIAEAYRPAEMPAFNAAIDWRVAAFAASAAVLASLVFGLAPGAHALGLAVAEGIKGRPSIVRRGWLRVGARESLLVVQVAASFALLVVAALFGRALAASGGVDAGFSTANVAVAPIEFGTAAPTDAERRALAGRLLRAADAVAGVEAATLSAVVPMTGSNIGVHVRDADRPDAPKREVLANIVAPGFFELVGPRLRAGRGFDEADREGGRRVAIVNETFARRFWDRADVVGRTLLLEGASDRVDRVEIVGVVGDARYRSLTEAFQPIVYVPFAQTPHSRFVLHARVRNGAGETMAALDRALHAVDSRVEAGAAMPMAALLEQAKVAERITESIGALAGALQLALALMAIWGLVAYAVQRRTAEIGIRLALGAEARHILQLVMRPTALLAAAGLAIGCAAGAAAALVMQTEFIGLAPIAFGPLLPVAAAFAAVIGLAAWLPARRATTIEPVAALRAE